MAGLQRVRFLRRHKQWQPGDEHAFPLGVADALVRCRNAEWADKAAEPAVEAAMVEVPAEQAVVKGRRGRPRKYPVQGRSAPNREDGSEFSYQRTKKAQGGRP